MTRRAQSSAGSRAIALAERLGETEILVHALNNVGSAEAAGGRPDGFVKLERSLALALDADLEEHVARAYTNLSSRAVSARDYAAADRHLSAGLAYCEEHDLDAWAVYMTGWLACLRLGQGRWDEAADNATAVLRRPNVAIPSRIQPLVVLGRLRARRGDPDPWGPLDEALELAVRTEELQRLAPVAAARAEARWLAGDATAVGRETEQALALALQVEDEWVVGELCTWRRRAGIEDRVVIGGLAAPYRLERQGDMPGRGAVVGGARLPVRGGDGSAPERGRGLAQESAHGVPRVACGPGRTRGGTATAQSRSQEHCPGTEPLNDRQSRPANLAPARDPGTAGRAPDQRRDRDAPLHHAEDRRTPRVRDPGKARRTVPPAGVCRGVETRVAAPPRIGAHPFKDIGVPEPKHGSRRPMRIRAREITLDPC